MDKIKNALTKKQKSPKKIQKFPHFFCPKRKQKSNTKIAHGFSPKKIQKRPQTLEKGPQK